MTTSLVALCADTASLQHPETMGLAGENLAAQDWLRLFPSAEEARRFLRSDRLVDEVWVVSSEDVAPINLAATLKRDRSDRFVCLVSFQETGSLKSRASATGIDASLTRQAFVARYAQRKERAMPCCGNLRNGAGAEAASPSSPYPIPVSAMCATAMPASAVAPAAAPSACGSTPVQAHAMPGGLAAAVPAARGGSAFLMPVVSGSGGAGKSTVAVLSALLAQGLGYDTLLLDFDLQFGDMEAMLGVQNPMRIEEVLSAPARLAQLRPEGLRPALLAAPKRLEDAEAVVAAAPQVLDRLSSTFDVIVCNTGAAWAEQHAVLLERSSKALFLVDQRPSSLRACQHALDLCARCGIAASPFSFVLNRCSKGTPLTSIDVSCALRGAHVAELKDGGPDVEEMLGAGLPLDLLESRNDLCTSLERLLLDVLPNAGAALREDEDATRAPGLRLLRGRRSRKRKRGAPCL